MKPAQTLFHKKACDARMPRTRYAAPLIQKKVIINNKPLWGPLKTPNAPGRGMALLFDINPYPSMLYAFVTISKSSRDRCGKCKHSTTEDNQTAAGGFLSPIRHVSSCFVPGGNQVGLLSVLGRPRPVSSDFLLPSPLRYGRPFGGCGIGPGIWTGLSNTGGGGPEEVKACLVLRGNNG